MSSSKLFAPIKVGTSLLRNRVVFAPSTRFRVGENHVILPHVPEYYSQRSKVPGTLLITEATLIAPRAAGYTFVPGIWSEEQITAWKKVTDVVHQNGSFIYLQLWALGRAADVKQLAAEDPSLPYVSASAVPLSDHPDATPRPLSIREISEYVSLYAQAASNAVHKAGFDGVEVHGANGYLLDQFIQDVSNKRTDEYGGSIGNRSRFALEVVDAVSQVVGEERTAIRFSPWNTFQDMRMAEPKPTFSHLVKELRNRHPQLAYVHVVEPRGDLSVSPNDVIPDHESNDFIRQIWGDKVLIRTGGYTRESAIKDAEEEGTLVGFARVFIANPDLPFRLDKDIPLTKGDRSTYYAFGSLDPKGYTDYPFSEQFLDGAVQSNL